MRRLLKLAFCLVVCVPVVAEGENWSDFLQLSGKAEANHISYFKKKQGKVNSGNEAVLQLDFQSDKKRPFGFFAGTKFLHDFSDDERQKVYANELYIFFKKRYFEVKAGKQLFEWGLADRVRPTDNICPVDYYDFLESEKLGVYAASLTFFTPVGRLQGVLLPVFTPSEMPGTTSRWYLDQNDVLSATFGGMNTNCRVVGSDEPERDLSAAQFAFQYSHSFAGFDLDVNYYNGFAHIPEFLVQGGALKADTVAVSLLRNYYRQQVVGGSLARVFGNYATRLEGAFFLPDGLRNDVRYFRYSAGIDRTFYNLFGDNNLFVLLQWMDELKKSGTDFSVYDINHLFTQSVMAKLEWSCGLATKFGLQGIYNFQVENYYVQPFVNYSVFDGLNTYCQLDILGGRKKGFYSYYDMQRVRLGLSYNF